VSLATTFYVTSPCNCAGRGDCYSGGSVCASMGLSCWVAAQEASRARAWAVDESGSAA
jgi:hypothetical protein